MSKKLKLSPWHDGSVKPVNMGIYEIKRWESEKERIRYGDHKKTMFSYFDGEHWRGWKTEKEFSEFGFYPKSTDFVIIDQNRKWRGVLK